MGLKYYLVKIIGKEFWPLDVKFQYTEDWDFQLFILIIFLPVHSSDLSSLN